MSRCASCGADITWAMTEAGKAIPIDTKPTPDGNITLHTPDGGGRPIAVVEIRGQTVLGMDPDEPRYTTHFTSCPDSAQWRKPRR